MLTIAGGHVNLLSVLLVAIGLLVVVGFVIVVGIHVFLTAVGHYAPWEQIWAG
jgi:hypothetical protein